MIAFIGGITNLLTRYDQGIIPMKKYRDIKFVFNFFRKQIKVLHLIGFPFWFFLFSKPILKKKTIDVSITFKNSA